MIKKKTGVIFLVLVLLISSSYLLWNAHNAFADTDNDGVLDSVDNCPTNANADQADWDSDKQGNVCDLDDDNDGVDDSLDSFDNNPKEWADFDFDGQGTSQDTDDDNDGIPDSVDTTPVLTAEAFATKYQKDLGVCLDLTETKQLLCMNDFFDKVIQNGDDVKAALAFAATLPRIGAVNDCHFLVHDIGEKAFDETGNLTKAFELGDRWCRSGFYHGVMVSYFHYLRENNLDVDNYSNVCEPLKGSKNYQNCFHGLGHGLIHYYNDDLSSADNYCNRLSYYPYTLCVGGVMMQYTDELLTRTEDSQDTVKNVCNISGLNELESQYCYIGLGITLAAHTNNDLEKSTEYCSVLPPNTQDLCQLGVKREIFEAQQNDVSTTPESQIETLQSFPVTDDQKMTVDILSSAKISNFEYDNKSLKFQTDAIAPITIYIPRTLLPDHAVFKVNESVQTDVVVQTGLVGNYRMIKLTPEEFGYVSMTPQ